LGVRKDQVRGRLWNFCAKIPELTYSSRAAVVPPVALPFLLQLQIPNLQSPLVRKVQQALKAKGFDPGKIDGGYGPHTMSAVEAFQASNRLIADGIVGPRTAKKLGVVWPT